MTKDADSRRPDRGADHRGRQYGEQDERHDPLEFAGMRICSKFPAHEIGRQDRRRRVAQRNDERHCEVLCSYAIDDHSAKKDPRQEAAVADP